MSSQPATPPLILVIDEDSHVLAEVAAAMVGSGHACHGCTTAAEAIEFVESTTPDLILSDVNLAGHSGLELCEQLKQAKALCNVPVMLLSGVQIPDIIHRRHAMGGVYHLRKPFDPAILADLVDKTLAVRHLVGSS